MTDLHATLRDHFTGHEPDVAAAYLFGSTARGDDGPASDVDIAVLYTSDPPATLSGLGVVFDLERRLEAVLGRSVDVVSLNAASIDLRRRVLCDGILLVDRDRSRRIRFETDTRREYFDVKPLLDRYRRVSGRHE